MYFIYLRLFLAHGTAMSSQCPAMVVRARNNAQEHNPEFCVKIHSATVRRQFFLHFDTTLFGADNVSHPCFFRSWFPTNPRMPKSRTVEPVRRGFFFGALVSVDAVPEIRFRLPARFRTHRFLNRLNTLTTSRKAN